ncbi:MAG: ribonuclease E inhibitor RraB [Terracidiphilus sp.]
MEFPDDENGDVLRRMAANGNDLSLPRNIDFTVVFPNESTAQRFTTPRSAARAAENFSICPLPEDAFDEINRIQTRQRLNDVVNTGSPGFIPRVRAT